MNRKKVIGDQPEKKLYEDICSLHEKLGEAFKDQFDRSLPLADELLDRWDRASKLGWAEGSNVYDSSYIFGKVAVGKGTWIGPFTIIDGTGGLTIGDHCTISAGVHIYTHDNVGQTLSGGKLPIEYAATTIGNNSYIGPQAILTKGITIGNHCVVASNSFVNKSIPDETIVAGNPAKVIGRVVLTAGGIKFDYSHK